MNRKAKTFIVSIGVLSTVSGVYLAISGAEFSAYFYGIFIGITLIGSAIVFREENDASS